MNETVRNLYNNFAKRLTFQKEINQARYQSVGKIAVSILKPQHSVLYLGCGIGTTSVIKPASFKSIAKVISGYQWREP